MQQEESNTKKIIISAIVFAALAAMIYFFFFRNVETPIFDEFGNPIQAQAIGADLISILERLQNVKLDPAIFNDEGFKYLKDFSVELVSQPQGRKNPFDKI